MGRPANRGPILDIVKVSLPSKRAHSWWKRAPPEVQTTTLLQILPHQPSLLEGGGGSGRGGEGRGRRWEGRGAALSLLPSGWSGPSRRRVSSRISISSSSMASALSSSSSSGRRRCGCLGLNWSGGAFTVLEDPKRRECSSLVSLGGEGRRRSRRSV